MKVFLSLVLVCSLLSVIGQGNSKPSDKNQKIEKQTLLGLQISPIISSDFIQKNNYNYQSDTANFSINHQTSFSYGAEIRHYFTYRFALSTGIFYTKRNIKVDFESQYPEFSQKTDTSFTGDLQFIAFEIPIKVSGYVRLLDQVYMSVGGGLNLNFYPTNIRIDHIYVDRLDHLNLGALDFFQLGFSANVGWEYRTPDSGIFYFGATYQAHLGKMAQVGIFEKETINRADYFYEITGNYLSLDFKYYFPLNEKKRF